MPQKFPYLINQKININDREIFCKVTGKPGSANDGQPYIIAITGGPGFGHELTEEYLRRLIAIAEKEGKPLPHFIVYDHLGCGQSDKALDPKKEYTVDHFTDLAANLVEAVKDKLNLPHMNLYVEGGSFGSLVAMNFPARKPEWLDSKSDISMKQVTSKVTANGGGMKPYTFDFLQKYYSDHPNYEKIKAAQEKLYSGDLQDQNDYVLNFVMPMASLYVKDVEKSVFNQSIKRFVTRFPSAIVKGLGLANSVTRKIGLEIEPLNFADHMLGKCSLDVLNHFFGHDFDGFNLIEVIKKHKHIYEQLPICLISANQDHVVDPNIAITIGGLLPETSSVIIFDEPHMLSSGPSRKIYDKLNYDLLIAGSFPSADLEHDVIIRKTIPEGFSSRLSDAHQGQQSIKRTPSLPSTAILMSAMPEEEIEEKVIEKNTRLTIEEIVTEKIPTPSSLPLATHEDVQQAPVSVYRPGY